MFYTHCIFLKPLIRWSYKSKILVSFNQAVKNKNKSFQAAVLNFLAYCRCVTEHLSTSWAFGVDLRSVKWLAHIISCHCSRCIDRCDSAKFTRRRFQESVCLEGWKVQNRLPLWWTVWINKGLRFNKNGLLCRLWMLFLVKLISDFSLCAGFLITLPQNVKPETSTFCNKLLTDCFFIGGENKLLNQNVMFSVTMKWKQQYKKHFY